MKMKMKMKRKRKRKRNPNKTKVSMKYAWENMSREEVESNVRNGERPKLPDKIASWSSFSDTIQVSQNNLKNQKEKRKKEKKKKRKNKKRERKEKERKKGEKKKKKKKKFCWSTSMQARPSFEELLSTFENMK